MEVNNEEKMVSKNSVSLKISFLLGVPLKSLFSHLFKHLVHLVLNTFHPTR